MAATATIRELRNHFPKVRKIVDDEGEILVTDRGVPKYRLTPYAAGGAKALPVPKDYMERLRRYQSRPLTAAAARALHAANRGER
jgi:prevent-host-death family protein